MILFASFLDFSPCMYSYRSFNFNDSCRSFSLLEAKAICFLTLPSTITVAIVRRAILCGEQCRKEAVILKTYSRNRAKKLRVTAFVIAKLAERFLNEEKKVKSPISFCNIERNRFALGAPIIFWSTAYYTGQYNIFQYLDSTHRKNKIFIRANKN